MAERTVSVRLLAVNSQFDASTLKTRALLKGMKSEISNVGSLAAKQSQGFDELGAVGLAAGGSILAGAAMAAKAAVSYESAFAGVRKTIDATESEFAALSDGIRDMATRMPASAVEIAGVAEAAGQLGVQKSAILGFTETMIQLGATTNLTADDAATSMAKLANIMQTPQDQFDNLGAALVDLGNNGASTERDIVEMAMRIASAGSQIGLTEGQVLGFANALSSVGIEAEAGGSSISRVMIEARNAVMDGSESLDAFASTAGMTTQEFQRAFEEDAGGAVISFVEGLGRMEEQGLNSNTVLQELGLTDIRVANALRAAAGAGDLFRESLVLGNDAYEANTALTEEYGRRLETTEAQMAILKNQVFEVAISFGEQMLPAVGFAVDALGNIVGAVGAVMDVLGPFGPALATLAGAVLTFSGGFLLAAPRIAATKEALRSLGVAAPRITGALGTMSKVAGGVAAAFVAVEVASQWAKASADVPGLESLTTSMLDLVDAGELSGEMLSIVGSDFEDLGRKLERAGDGFGDMLSNFGSGGGWREVEEAKQQIDALDKSLASLTTRDPDAAARLFEQITDAAQEQGVSLETVNDRFNDYGEALAAAEVTERTATEQAGALTEATDDLGVSVDNAEAALDEFKSMLDSILGQAFSVTEAEDALTSSIFALEDQVKAAKEAGDGWTPTLEGNSRAAVDNRDAVMELIGASADLVRAYVEQGASSEEVQAVLEQEKGRLNEVLAQLGFNIQEVGVYTGVLDQIPADVGTTVTVTGAENARSLIEGIAGAMARLQGAGIDVAVNAVGALGVRPFAEGGMLPSDARIQPPGTLVQWAEPSTGGEAFIPMGAGKRARSEQILAQVADVFGFGLVPMAEGGAIRVDFGSSLATAARSLATMGAAPKGSATGLDPEFFRRFNAYNQALGGGLSITSGFRSYAQQASLYAKYLAGTGNLAAPPGRSKHERGLAIDHSPRSTASMRATARRFRLGYPVPGEPWHVEPFANGGIRGLSPSVRMASGGIVAGAVRDTRFSGALMGTGLARARENPGYTADEVEEVAKAWYELAVNVDEATANMILGEGLLASEITDASRRIIDAHQAEQRAQEEAAEASKRAAEDDYRRRVEANNNAFELGRMSTADHLSNLERRMARETELSGEWMALYRQREQVLRGITDAEEEAADALDRRVGEFSSWSDVTQRVSVGWGNSAAALTRNIADQVDMFTDWASELEALKRRGLSADVVEMLGLGEGPQSLGQIRTLAGASASELRALNAAAGNRGDVFRDRAIAEGNIMAAPAQVTTNVQVFVGSKEITDLVKVTLRSGQADRMLTGSRG